MSKKSIIDILCVSDTHNCILEKLPLLASDLLIFSGDCCFSGSLEGVCLFNNMLEIIKDRFDKIIYVPGNHDRIFEKDTLLAKASLTNAEVLINEDITYNGFKIWGSPITPEFNNWAFNRKRGAEIRRYWDAIPKDTDILITHGPPLGILDTIAVSFPHLGCEDLFDVVTNDVKPKLHVFGHIHGGYGTFESVDTCFVNASIMDERYYPRNRPIKLSMSLDKVCL